MLCSPHHFKQGIGGGEGGVRCVHAHFFPAKEREGQRVLERERWVGGWGEREREKDRDR